MTETKRTRGDGIRRYTTATGQTRYAIRVDVSGPDGRRKQERHVFRTLAEARASQRRIMSEVASGRHVGRANLTVDHALDSWLAAKRPSIKPTTYSGYVDALKPVRATLGARRLQTVAKSDIEAVVAQMLTTGGPRRQGRSPRTTNLMLTVARAAWADFEADGSVAKNVVALVRKVKAQHVERATWTPAQLAEFVATAKHHDLYAGFVLSCRGLRRGEVCGLRWRDVDAERGEFTIRSNAVTVASRTVYGEPKTTASRRTLPIDPDLSRVLTRHRIAQQRAALAAGQQWTTDYFILANPDGSGVRPEYYSDEFTRQATRLGLPPIVLHGLRHASVSAMLEAGVPVLAVAAWHGHDPAMTLRTYGHVHKAALAAAGTTLAGILGSGH